MRYFTLCLSFIRKNDLRTRVCCFAYSFFFLLAQLIGHAMYETNSIRSLFSPISNAFFGMLILGAGTILIGMVLLLLSALLDRPVATPAKPLTSPAFRWVLFLLFWVPCLLTWLAYYPGIFAYDITQQTDQALGLSSYSRFHPPLHTFFWQLCLEIARFFSGSEELCIQYGLSVYAVLQSLIQSLILSRILADLEKRGTSRVLRWVTVFLLAFHPMAWIFSINPCKDSLFAPVFVLFLYRLSVLLRAQPGTRTIADRIRLFSACVLCCLLRNNMLPALVPAFFLLIVFFRDAFRQIRIPFTAALIASMLISGPLYSALGILPGSRTESLGLPIQQIAFAYQSNREAFPPDMLETMDRMMSTDTIVSFFNPRMVDGVKFHLPEAFQETETRDFLNLYFDVFTAFPGSCLNAFLTLNLPLWYCGASGVDPFAQREYIETFLAFYNDRPAAAPIRNSLFPAFCRVLERFASYELQGGTILQPFTNMAFPFWAILLLFLRALSRRRKEAFALLIPLLFWATYLAGPVSCLRYVYPLYLALPVLLNITLRNGVSDDAKTD